MLAALGAAWQDAGSAVLSSFVWMWRRAKNGPSGSHLLLLLLLATVLSWCFALFTIRISLLCDVPEFLRNPEMRVAGALAPCAHVIIGSRPSSSTRAGFPRANGWQHSSEQNALPR